MNYLYIAKGSAGEVRCQLYAALDIGYLNIEKFKYLKGLAEDCSRLLYSFIEKIKLNGRLGLQNTLAERKDPLEEFLGGYGYVKKDGRMVPPEKEQDLNI